MLLDSITSWSDPQVIAAIVGFLVTLTALLQLIINNKKSTQQITNKLDQVHDTVNGNLQAATDRATAAEAKVLELTSQLAESKTAKT